MTEASRRTRPIRIGSIAACSGDRRDALAHILSSPIEVDAIVGDYLAEMNLSWRKAEIEHQVGDGHDPVFLDGLRTAREQLQNRLEAGTFPKIVVNAGGLNPGKLAEKTQDYLNSTFGPAAGSLKVAYIVGDDVLHVLNDSATNVRHLTDSKKTLAEWAYNPVIANAYIGQFGYVKALQAGADIVIAGRATDAGSTQALATWWYGWHEEDYNNHALGLIAGHLIECGTYVTGGNFCGFKKIQPYYDLGFPIAEVYNDGHVIITKQPDQNGLVSVDTVRSQLLYEIQGRYYYNPDVIADLAALEIYQDGKDRVHVSGFRGLPPPPSLKVAVQAYAGYQSEILIYAVGLDIDEKAKSFEIQTRRILDQFHGPENPLQLAFQLLGRCEPDPKSQAGATAVIRLLAKTSRKEDLSAENFMGPVIENLIQGFPGFTPNLEYPRTSQPKPYLAYFPCLLDRTKVDLQVCFAGENESILVPHRPATGEPAKQENYEPTNPVNLRSFGESVKIPLGYQVYSRSGDKGANVNVGFFPQSDSQEEWDWLRSFLTTAKLLELLGKDKKDVSRTERVEFPNLHSVHFVLFDLLGGGVTDTVRTDSLGKAIAEYVRAKVVDYPAKLYKGYENRI